MRGHRPRLPLRFTKPVICSLPEAPVPTPRQSPPYPAKHVLKILYRLTHINLNPVKANVFPSTGSCIVIYPNNLLKRPRELSNSRPQALEGSCNYRVRGRRGRSPHFKGAGGVEGGRAVISAGPAGRPRACSRLAASEEQGKARVGAQSQGGTKTPPV